MYHYVNNLQTTAGDALVGYYVKLKDADGNFAALYADESLTPILSVSGVADAAVTDDRGVFDLYVADGSYDVCFYDVEDSTLLIDTWSEIPLFSQDLGVDVEEQSGTTYTLTEADNGKILYFTSASAVTVTVPASLRVDFACSIAQGGVGQVTVSAGVGVTIVNTDSQFSTQAQYVRLTLWATAADAYVLEGRTA